MKIQITLGTPRPLAKLLVLAGLLSTTTLLPAASTFTNAVTGALNFGNALAWNPNGIPDATDAVVNLGSVQIWTTNTTENIAAGNPFPYIVGTINLTSQSFGGDTPNDQIYLATSTGKPVINWSGSGNCYFYTVLSGRQGFIKTGGSLLLYRYNSNPFTNLIGNTEIAAGTLAMQIDGNFGVATNQILIDDGASLEGWSTINKSASGVYYNTLPPTRTIVLQSATGTAGLCAGGSTEALYIQGVISGTNTGSGFIENVSGGIVILGGANTFQGPTTLANGTLDLSNYMALQYSTLIKNGGTLQFDGGLSGGMFNVGGLSGSGAITLQDNVASGPITLNVGGNNLSTTYAGTLSGPGSLVKSGTNILTLSGVSSYTGPTVIQGGDVILLGSSPLSGTSQIIVSNATLDLSGITASLSINGFGLTNSTTIFAVDLDYPGIIASGTLATGGATNILNLTTVPGSALYPTNITLITYGTADASLVDSHNNLTTLGAQLPTLGGVQGYLTNNIGNHSIDLVMTAGPGPVLPITWNGQQGGVNNSNWDVYITTNWVTTTGGLPYLYQDTSAATFDDTLQGSPNVYLKSILRPGSLTFNNTTVSYVLSGPGSIYGGPMTLNGSGVVTLMETGGDKFGGGITVNSGTLIIDDNSGGVTGGTSINGGTVQVGNGDANGVLPTGNVVNYGGLIFDRTDTALSIGNVISGTGDIIKTNTGTVALTVYENGYFGNVTIDAGTLAFGAPNANPSGIAHASTLTINSNATAQVNVDNGLMGTTINVGPTVVLNAGGTLTGLASADSGAGTSSHITGTVSFNGGTLAMNGTQVQAAYGSWDLDNSVTVNGLPFTSTISAKSVVPHQPGGTYFTINSGGTPSGIDLLVSGTFINGTSANDTGIIVEGNGTMVLDGNNSYAHGTTIYGSLLQLGLPTDTNVLTALGTGWVTNGSNGILEFSSSKGINFAGGITDDGSGVIIFNSGTNTLSGTNTYTANTFVNGGVLKLSGNGSINNSMAIAISNAILDVSSASAWFANTNSLALTNSTFKMGGNLANGLSSLSLSNATVSFSLNTGTPNIILGGNPGMLTTGGSTNLINVTQVAVPGVLAYPTNITVIKYSAADPNLVSGNNQLTTLGLTLATNGSPVGYLTNNVSKKSIDLVLLSGPVYKNTNDLLTLLSLSVGTLSPAFTNIGFAYSTTNAYGSTPTVTAVNADPTATDQLIYSNTTNSLASGVASAPLTLNPNPGVTNVVKVQVTAQDGVTINTYTVNVIQLPSQSPPVLTGGASSGALTINWPQANQGYRLQVQTNLLSQGLGTNWSTWPNSTVTNKVIMTINATNPSVFLRMVYP